MWTQKRIYLLKENIPIVPMLFSLCRRIIIPHFLRFVNPFEIFLLNWGLSVCANFNLNLVGEDIILPHNQLRGIVSFEEIKETVQPSPSPAGKVSLAPR